MTGPLVPLLVVAVPTLVVVGVWQLVARRRQADAEYKADLRALAAAERAEIDKRFQTVHARFATLDRQIAGLREHHVDTEVEQ